MPARSGTIRARGAVAAMLAALAAAPASGCGPSDGARGLSNAERATLQRKLTEVRGAAANRDRRAAETALDEFVDEVGALQAQGALDAVTASAFLTGAARARRQLAVEVKPPPPPPTRQPARTEPEKKPKPKEQERQGGDDDDDGRGKDKKGRGEGTAGGGDD